MFCPLITEHNIITRDFKYHDCMTTPLRSISLLAIVVCAMAGECDGQTMAVSPAIKLDTRITDSTQMARSTVVSLDTRRIDGLSGSGTSGSARMDTRSLYPQALVIAGPSVCPVGGRVGFQALAQYPGGSTEDVSAQVVWHATGAALNATGLEQAFFSGNSLTAGVATWTEPVLITAAYPFSNGKMTSAPYSVTIGSGDTLGVLINLAVANGQYLRSAGSGSYVWQINASAHGEVQTTPGVSYQWYLNDVLQGGTSSNLVQEYTGTPATVSLKVVATDSLGRTGTDSKVFSFQRPAPNEPGQKYPATRPAGSTLTDNAGQSFQFDSARIPNGLIVITHGLTDSPNADWIKNLATAIEGRLKSEGKPLPNIAIFGWEKGANPLLKDLVSTDSASIGRILKIGSPEEFNIIPYLGQYFYGFATIKPYATVYAITLSQWIQDEKGRNHIDASKPIQFIGHSAGGFVTTGAASYLQGANVKVTQVTTLDTPLLDRNIVTTLMNNGTTVERYISSALGATVPELGEEPLLITAWIDATYALPSPEGITHLSNYLSPGGNYYRQILSSWWAPIAGPNTPTPEAHDYSHDWYITSAQAIMPDGTGFAKSPFMQTQSSAAPASDSAPAAFAAVSAPGGDTPTPAALGGFSSFGSVTGGGSPYVLTEDTNAGIQQTLTLPVGADALQFRYQFTTAGDGDFIAVYFGDNPPLFIGPDVTAARTAPLAVNVPLQGYEGQTGTLVIKLVSQGQPNAVVQIDQITMSTTDDPDHDGLTNTQEQTLDTNPLLYDTDGDGIGDWDEVNTTLTNPLKADSDGDGMTDSQEIIAGTNGLDANSVFRTNGTTVATNGSVTVTWSAKAGKMYQVQRSDTPSFANYTVVGDSIVGTAPTTNFNDSSVPRGTARQFYRVQVE